MTRRTTLQDIADRVGVTRATVSLALSGKGRMAAATRSRIRAVADELDYVPNSVARNLRASRSGSIGLHIPDNPLSYPYYLDVVYGAVKRAQESDLLVTIVPAEVGGASRFEDRLDGFIVVDPEDDDPMVGRLLASGRPVVSAEAPPPGSPAPRAIVSSGNRAAVRSLVEHLVSRGARSILAVSAPPTAAWAREVIDGFGEAVRAAGVRGAEVELPLDPTAEMIGALIADRVARDARIDAVLCAAEGAAVLALAALEGVGRRVGVDILLASFIDSSALRVTTPAVTALDLLPREIGRACVDALVASIDAAQEGAPRVIRVPPRLHVRASSDALAR